MKKRIISLILALALCVGMLPAPVFAEEAPGAQTLEKEVVSQNEEPQPEPATQNEEGQEPQGEPEQGEPQEEPQGEPQEEPEQEEPPVQSVLKANAPMAVAEGENGEEVTLTVGEQNGKLFDGVNSAATFPVTCENGNLNSLEITFSPENSDLTATVSEDGTTVTVMTAGNAKAGTYQMTLALGQTSQTVPVIVDVPFTIKNREIQVASDQTSATLTLEVDVAPELEGQVQYTWMPDGKNSVVTNTNTVTLHPDNLKQDENSPGRYSAWVDCRVSCGTYFGIATREFVKIIACDHSGAILYTKEGTCRGCGQLCPEDCPFITENGSAIEINSSTNERFFLDSYFPGTLYLWTNYTTRRELGVLTLNGDGTLELQNHIVCSELILDYFQNHSFTIQNGSLQRLLLGEAGSLILENVTVENMQAVPSEMNLKLHNVTFKNRVCFHGTASMNGGTFEEGLCNEDENHTCLDLLAPGYAFAKEDGTVINASDKNVIRDKVQVVSHPTCTYKADKAGKCDCGRSCPHESLNEQGYCTVCKMLVEPFAIGEQGYRSLEEAQTAAQEGQTIYLRGDYELPNPVVISKNITLDVCGYTLSGSSENALLQITGTDVTVQKGDIWNTQAPAVTVKSGANLTVKTASFGGGPDHVLVVEQGGRADVHNGGFLHGVLYVDGSLSMKNGLQVNLKLGPNVGKISIVEGNFDSITLAGGKEYKDLLAEGSAYWADGAWVKLVEAQEKTPVVIAECPHQDGLAGSQACPYCGKTCGHGNMDQETGFCKDCGYQVCKAKVDDEMMSTFQEAMDAAQAGKTVTLLADDSLGGNLTLDKKITLNINGCTLKTRYFTVQAPLTICGGGEIESDFSFNAQVTVQGTRLKAHKGVVEEGGSLCIDQGATVTLVTVFPGGSLELKQGTIDTLIVDGGEASLISGTISKKMEVVNGTLLSILAPGKALKKDGNIVNGNVSTVAGLVTVVDHTHMFDGSTTCPCGYTAAATLATEAGKQYFANFSEALEAAKAASGSTLTLFQDVALTGESNLYIDSGTFTIDWHGHTLSGETSNDLLLITDAANVTLTDSVGTGGVHNTDGAAIGAYVRSQGSLTIRGGVYSPQLWKGKRAYGSIQISGGEFQNPTDGGRYGALYCETGALADLLAPGYAFAYEDDDSLFDVYGARMPVAYRTVCVVEHPQHDFEDGKCHYCGYLCPHDEVDEWGVCTDCGKRFYVQGTYADGTIHYYGTLSDALKDPAVTQAVIIGTLSDEECESWDGGDRSVTLDLNGFGTVIKSVRSGHLILRDSSESGSILAVKEIQQDGQVSVESGTVFPQGENLSVYVYGKLTVTGGYVGSLTAMEGSTVSLSGGSFGKIVGGGVTLKELLAEDCYYAQQGDGTPKDYADTDTVLEQVSVVVCDHTSVRETKQGHFPVYTCNCGKVRYLLTVTVGESDKKYFGDYNTGFAYAAKSDGVVRFLELNGTIEVNAQGMVTIDMENRSYSAYGRSLVIKSGSTVKLVGQGAVMSKPEAGGGSGSSGKLEYSEFIPVTVESGGTFVLPANNLNGEPNMAKPTQLTVQSGGTAELQGGSTQWTDVYGTLKISGGSHWYIHQYEMGQLNITGGQIQLLQIYGDLPQNALSGGSYVTISVMEFKPGETEKFRDVTFADFQKMLVSGKVFQKKQDQSYPNEVEETPNYGTFNYVKELNNVNVTAAPFTGVQVVCQLGADTYEEPVSTQYNVGETDSSGNVVFRLGVNIQSQEVQSGVTVQWYELGAEDSRTPVGTGLTCPLDLRLPVGTHRFLAVVNCSGYVLESQPFAVTITPRVVNITGGFTAQDRDYELDNRSVRIIQGEVTFDKKAEEDDLSAQVHGGTIATPDAGQDRTVDYSVTLTGRDKDNYTLGSVPELTVTIRPIAQTLTFAETAVTKTYGDSPFVNALDHSAGDGPITYTSSDPAVATVGIDGTVTIRGAGEARITATAAATQNYVETAASFDLTVAKATGTVRNRNYSLGYLYGDDIPTPERKYFEASSTGAFRYSWSPAAPKNAGKYQLTVTVDEDGNYTSVTLVLNVLVEKDVWVRPTLVKAENETVDGKKDGKVTYTDTPALEYRIKRAREWLPVAVSTGAESVTVEGLAPGTYEFRRPGDENHFASSPETITIQPGPKLTVTLPSPQTGYTLTASKTQLGWHEDVELSFQLDSVGAYKAADFGIWAEAGSEKTKLTLGNDGAVKLTAPEKDITITVTGVKTDNVAPQASIRGRLRKDSGYYVKWEGFQENPADDFVNGDFVISATDRLSGVADFWYYLSDKPLTLEELKGMNGAFWARPANQGKVSITEDGEYYLYVKALDKANNAGYACTGKLVKESNPPTFSGVKDGETYYVSQQMEIHDDGMPDWYMAKGSIGVVPNGGNENPIKLRLPNNGSSYTFTVGDRCGNEASITVYMKPLSDLTQPLDSILEDTIRKSDRATLDDVEATLKGLDVTYATEPEKKEMNDALARIAQLRQVLDQVAAVEAQIDALPDSVEPYQQTVEDTQIKPARQAYSDLTDHQKTLVDSTKLDKLVRLEAQLNAWTITEGDGQTWFKGSWNPLSFTVNGQTRKFSKVLLDGKMYITATPSFLAVSGSTDEPFTLTLKPEFLQVSMEPGEHTLTVIYGENNSRTGTVTFTVEIPANYLDVTNKPEFDGKTTVTIDGAEYPIEEMNGTRYVNLPETGDLLTIYSFKDGTPTGSHTNYPTGMQVFRITRQEGGAKAEEITEFANLLNYAGCSIRISGKQGIRMITGIDQDVKKSLVSKAGLAGYTLEEYGTVVQWADTLGSNTLNLDNSNKQNYAYKKGKADPIFAKADGMIQYTNVLVGFTDAQCEPDLVLRPYIKLKDMTTGEIVTLYGGSVTRSIGYVAWQNRDTYKPGSSGYKYVHKIINAVYGKTEQGG